MKRTILLSCFVLSASIAVAVEVDGVAAKVGSAVILKSDVVKEMRRLGASEDRYADFRNELIDRQLILKAAADAKMVIQDWVVENRIREIIKNAFGGDRNKLVETLAKEKVAYPEWRQRMKDDMIVGAMRWQVVEKNATCSPAEMRAEYDAHPERYQQDHRVTVSVILLGPDNADKREEVDKALKNEDFAEVARLFSEDVHASEGGQWKDVNPEEVFKPAICKEIAAMPKSTISKWIELDGWSFLLRKDSEDSGRRLSFAEAYDTIEHNVKEASAAKLYQAWIERLRAETYIKVY